MQTQDEIIEPTQPETPAPEASAADAQLQGGEAQEQEPSQETQDEPGRPRKPVQRRLDEITRGRHEAERAAAYWQGVATARQPGASQTSAPAAKPTPDQFADYAQYVEAITDWKAEQKVAEALARRDETEQRNRAQAAEQARVQTWAERQQAARAELPDFDDVIEASNAPMSGAMREVILESELGPRIAYHLAQHPQDAARIARLPPLAAAREMGRIEAALAKPAEKPALRTVSNAPPPITPVRGAGGQFVKAAENMSDAEWWASRKKT